MSYAVLFPGQGSQFVGMGADLFAARPDLLGDAADEVLGWSLRDVCLKGPEDELTRTDRAQPALYALSYALWDTMRDSVPEPGAAAGHSLGEYTALAAAGALDYTAGLELVAARGRAMAAAAARQASGMAALLGVDAAAAEDIAAAHRESGGRLWVANINDPSQVVVAGAAADIDWVVEHARTLGVRRAVRLHVAGAFHSPLMQPAAEELAGALDGAAFVKPAYAVWGNASASPLPTPPSGALVDQLTSPVRFQESLERLRSSGIETFVHVGPGNVTAGMARRTVRDAEVLTVSGPEDVDAAVAALAAT